MPDFSKYRGLQPLYTEYNVGNFSRSFRLSSKIDQGKITADSRTACWRSRYPWRRKPSREQFRSNNNADDCFSRPRLAQLLLIRRAERTYCVQPLSCPLAHPTSQALSLLLRSQEVARNPKLEAYPKAKAARCQFTCALHVLKTARTWSCEDEWTLTGFRQFCGFRVNTACCGGGPRWHFEFRFAK
jgi:hypothetical protein